MNALIKSGSPNEASAVRRISVLRTEHPGVSAIDQERELGARQLATLQAELQARSLEVRALHDEVAAAYVRGQEEGRLAGRSEAEDRQAQRVALLERSLQQVQNEIGEGIKSLEQLAVLLARDCLDVLLGNPNYRAELVGEIVRTQVARVERSLLVDIRVSPDDFPDAQALAAVAGHAGIDTTSLSTSPSTPGGGCVMTLQLGKMDVGLAQQWGVLREALDEIGAREGST